MAINHRRGKIGDFDPNKMTTAEWAFPDDGTARYCVAPGNVKTVATKEELQEILTSSPEAYQALLQLIGELEDNPSELTNILNNIVDLQANKIDTDAIANNLVTTEAGLVLDARQGKVIDDKVTTLNNNLANMAIKFTALANTPYTVNLASSHIYILISISSNAAYQCAYFAIRADSSNSYLVPVSTSSNITVASSGGNVVITVSNYNMPFVLVELNKFMK